MWATNKGQGNIKVNISELPIKEGIRATTITKEGTIQISLDMANHGGLL